MKGEKRDGVKEVGKGTHGTAFVAYNITSHCTPFKPQLNIACSALKGLTQLIHMKYYFYCYFMLIETWCFMLEGHLALTRCSVHSVNMFRTIQKRD